MSPLLLPALLAAFGCTGGDANFRVVEEAGVRTVTSIAPAWSGGAKWRVDTLPERVAGDASRADGALLVNVTGVHLLEDGRLAVVSGEDRQVVYFDRDGALERRVGAHGDASGQFQRPRLIGTRADSLWIWDAELQRVTVMAPTGEVALTVPVPPGYSATGVFGDGSLLLVSARVVPVPGGLGLQRDSLLLHAVDDGGQPSADALMTVPGDEMVVARTAAFQTAFPRPFGAQTTVAANGDWLQVAVGDSEDLLRVKREGARREVWRIARARRAVPFEDLQSHGMRRRAQVAQLPPLVANKVADAIVAAGVPNALPVHDQQIVDATGHTWLREDVGPEKRDSVAQRWDILAEDGRWLGQVTTPVSFAVWQITRERVVGVRRNQYGVEEVHIYWLRR
ncbi:MAG: hypothetical protein SFU84_09920 [Gemmatimonadales bacterium]|nr:hypothetical protein [Gemmatimonadales bacterium]